MVAAMILLTIFSQAQKLISVRKIEKDDLDFLAELFVSVFNSEPWSENWTKEWAYDRLNIIFNSYRFFGYMAVQERVPVGAIFSRIGSYMGELELEIMENYVSGDAQRKGVGSALLRELKLNAKKAGVACFVLQTDKTTFAKNFYLKHGFQGHEENLLMSHEF